jgi:hypothetical protein
MIHFSGHDLYEQKLHRFCGRRCGGHRVNECAGWVLYCMCTDHTHSLHPLTNTLTQAHCHPSLTHMHTVPNAARSLSFTLSRTHAHSHARLLHGRFCSHQSALALDRRALATKESAGPYSHISTVGVVGLGSMGHGVAQLAATAGYKVVVSETSTERLEKVKTAHRFTPPRTSHAMDTHKQSK